jgi:metal-responsive CopG/Arc/MetJ family transcriptional regulator
MKDTREIKRCKFINPTIVALELETQLRDDIDSLLVGSLPTKSRNEWIREVLQQEVNYHEQQQDNETTNSI